ncbi:MAG: isoaspartyl peptidase/L-asparaginase [Planctomycetota bacterium]
MNSRLFVWIVATLVLSGCQLPSGGHSPAQDVEYAIAIHGGAGVISKDLAPQKRDGYLKSLRSALEMGRDVLAGGGSSLDAVVQVVAFLEDDPRFNAGKGAVYTNAGTHELDAAVMDGSTLACGSVTGITTVKNPILLARMVMTQTRHVFLMGEGAEQFATEMQLTRVPQSYFHTERRYQQWQKALEKQGQESSERSTVGAVALDRNGNLAAATSTGGLTNKRFGRVGDTPVIGAGTYANDQTCAISCTGVGEEFIRHGVAREISARMLHRKESLQEASRQVVHGLLKSGEGGIIGVGRDGSLVWEFNTTGMFRGAADSTGRLEVKIWE